jgi:hypothetical protein
MDIMDILGYSEKDIYKWRIGPLLVPIGFSDIGDIVMDIMGIM